MLNFVAGIVFGLLVGGVFVLLMEHYKENEVQSKIIMLYSLILILTLILTVDLS